MFQEVEEENSDEPMENNTVQITPEKVRVEKEYMFVRIYYIYYLIRSNAADGQRTADG